MNPRPDPPPPTISEKVNCLSRPAAYGRAGAVVERRETHMSWVFLVGDRAFKLKKPVRFDYLDFSTLPRREAACRAEVALNGPLAPGVYRGVAPLKAGPGGLNICGEGEVVDWLVVMRRLDERHTLERRLADRPPSRAELDRLARALAGFYRSARPVGATAAAYQHAVRRALDDDRSVLLRRELGLPSAQVHHIDAVMRRFLRTRGDQLGRRARRRRIVEVHGDLRPEHIWLGDEVKVIDRLEFNRALRIADPVDELAFLDLECERLGSPGAGRRLREAVQRRLHDDAPRELVLFHRCHRAMLRARLSIAHLLEPRPRTPRKWPRQARAYLRLAARDARELELLLNRPAGR
ncbi:MAG: hypothetical protein ACHP84_18290 [Caulobacterales bacterium]